MTYIERHNCPQCNRELSPRLKPIAGEAGVKYCNYCHETHTWDIYKGDPIVTSHHVNYKPRTMITGQVCEICGRVFEFERVRATCPDNNNACGRLLAGRNARKARLRNQSKGKNKPVFVSKAVIEQGRGK